MTNEVFEAGLRMRREVVGAEYVDRAFEQADDFSIDFQNLVTEYCWGAAWGRDGLSKRDRSLLVLVMLGTLGRSTEFKTHFRGAITNGCTKDELKDALIQLSIYAGIPAGVEAFRLAQEAFADLE